MLRRRSCTGGDSAVAFCLEKNTRIPPATGLGTPRYGVPTRNHSRLNVVGGKLTMIISGKCSASTSIVIPAKAGMTEQAGGGHYFHDVIVARQNRQRLPARQRANVV
jgi:hypothetical protein